MNENFNFDLNEPVPILDLVKPHAPVTVGAFNAQGHSDYHWWDALGVQVEVERKTYGEVYQSVDDVEAQLFEHMTKFPKARHVFLLEGLTVQTWKGMALLKPSKGKDIYIKGWESPRNMKGIWSKLYRIGQYVEIVPSPSTESSATILLAMYESDKKAEHSTFNRNYSRPTYHPNPQVSKLMGAYPGIGERRATALMAEFTTLWNVLNAGVEDLVKVPGIGKILARRILKEAGRPDVV